MLVEFVPELTTILLPREDFRPYPQAQAREVWLALPQNLRSAKISQGETYLDYNWPSLPATLFMDFWRTGNRTRYEERHFARRRALGALVLAECIEGEGRFLDQIANGIWYLCEESFWGVPAHIGSSRALPPQEPIIDLFASETGALLAWTYFLLFSELQKFEPELCTRIENEVATRILVSYLESDFPWQGFSYTKPLNNWNPWCNLNCLVAFLLLETDFQKRIAGVGKILKSLQRFLDGYAPDGGCDEGPSYWNQAGGNLFNALELLLAATGGKLDLFSEPLIQEIGRYLVRVHIADHYFINVADCSPKVEIDPALVWAYGEKIKERDLQALAAYSQRTLSFRGTVPPSLQRQLRALFSFAKIDSCSFDAPFYENVWLADLQLGAAREKAGSKEGFYLAVKGGHNAESHNHNDVGQFIVYLDGRPILIDPGVETYTAKTFSSQRYEIWTMQSAYHNLPTVSSYQQEAGEDYRATSADFQVEKDFTRFFVELTKAYPKEAGIRRWQRSYSLYRNPSFVKIVDDFELQEAKKALCFNFITPLTPKLEGNTIILKSDFSPQVRLVYKGPKLLISFEEIKLTDSLLTAVWGEKLYRLKLEGELGTKVATSVLKVYAIVN